jgi:hypothetical protein
VRVAVVDESAVEVNLHRSGLRGGSGQRAASLSALRGAYESLDTNGIERV